MIYLDSSVLLARLLDVARSPAEAFWRQPFTASQLLEYEVINRVLVRPDWSVRIHTARHMLDRVVMVELTPVALIRALAPFPIPVRTLDGLHLATMDFLRLNGQTVELASYDLRLNAAAQALGFDLVAL